MKYYISQAPANPVTRVIAALVASICLLGAFFFGLVILAVIAVLIAVFGLVFWIRAWWYQRRAPAGRVQREPGSASDQKPQDFIEAEYTVVSERRD
ncbi:MAG TPA: hypothetical protein VFG52_04135 [Xanthomonadales bacterium]|nr:hypothetical protein [Xanthomonadales bacterium]